MMKKQSTALFSIVFLIAVLLGSFFPVAGSNHVSFAASSYDYILMFPTDRYPETRAHIKDAIAAGKSDICTIDRDGTRERREEALEGYPPKKGYDRDEWPMAMCLEGGRGADIRYISPSDNRGAGSWVGNKLSKYSDGTRVKFIVK
ncbi:NucA/NucB deoxyribonuclease domain-containing protein [Paenibacillus ehimensis]|uniref:NucA/NucB deoxyribonuclease domain-containing protein n=1 Tax=Paenibacillus ehimensis TaxID=79264 RepID=A0ABT8V490_9BACL|nr:NucA/NucB deoxyribonuclease domain-containing protein [Paenibacillus ehimensis]MDO3676242.1 NucA/NucB deoxyribonuclease domain-containing protein [Paenibacillus ehimensis]MEC0210077.1 NucA/NucB deoxyribonuclease domain-containing protein [Paenibacillus ehimensis]